MPKATYLRKILPRSRFWYFFAKTHQNGIIFAQKKTSKPSLKHSKSIKNRIFRRLTFAQFYLLN